MTSEIIQIGNGDTLSAVITSRLKPNEYGSNFEPVRLMLRSELPITGTCDQGELVGCITYHNGCQPDEKCLENTILPHWTLYGIFLHRYAADGSVPKFQGEIEIEGRNSYGMESGKAYPAHVLNSSYVTAPDGVTFAACDAAINYLKNGAIYADGELLTNVKINISER